MLRLRLLTEGVVVNSRAATAWRDTFAGPLTLGEYATTAGVSLRLEGGLFANAPVCARTEDSVELDYDGCRFVLNDGSGVVRVWPVPVPGWVERRQIDRMDGVERPYSSFGVTHSDRCRVSPIAGCAWTCKFCELPYELRYRRKHELDLLEVVKAAAVDQVTPARHVLVSGGTPRSSDEPWFDGVLATIAERSPIPVDVMMPARTSIDYPRWLRSVGVNSVSVNLEIFDKDRARALMPRKARLGRDHFLKFIEAAVDAFGVGFVQSLVLVGSAIEPIGSTIHGIRALADRGCIPVLSPFRPHLSTPLASAAPVTLRESVAALEAAEEACSASGSGVRPGPRCVACHHNTIASADGDPFYCYADDDLTLR